MNRVNDNVFPSSENLALLQNFMEPSVPTILKNRRAQALQAYAQLPVQPFHDLNRIVQEVAWETVNFHDFYVPYLTLPQGVFLCDIRDFVRDHADLVTRYMTLSTLSRKAVALVEACFNRGAVLYIPAQACVVMPIELQQLLGAYRQHLLLEKLIIIVGSGAQVTIHDTVDSSMMGAHTALRVIDYYIGDNALVTVQYEQKLSLQTQDVTQVTITCGVASTITYNAVVMGGSRVHMWIDCLLQGTHAQALLRGAYAVTHNQSYTMATRQDHYSAQAHSDCMIKGVVHGNAVVRYTGDIFVAESAYKTEAMQDNHTILLSSQARAYAKPQLQVLTNDVQCAHGTAVGQLDSEQLLYMQSRGFTREQAQQLLLEGFLSDVVTHRALVTTMLQKVIDPV